MNHPVVEPSPPAAPRPRRLWPALLFGALVVALLGASVGLLLLWQLGALAADGVTVTLNGQTWHPLALQGWSLLAVAATFVFAVLIVLVVVLVVVPLALVLAAFGIAIGLASAVLALAFSCSPLLLLAALVWWLLRPRRPPAATA